MFVIIPDADGRRDEASSGGTGTEHPRNKADGDGVCVWTDAICLPCLLFSQTLLSAEVFVTWTSGLLFAEKRPDVGLLLRT